MKPIKNDFDLKLILQDFELYDSAEEVIFIFLQENSLIFIL